MIFVSPEIIIIITRKLRIKCIKGKKREKVLRFGWVYAIV